MNEKILLEDWQLALETEADLICDKIKSLASHETKEISWKRSVQWKVSLFKKIVRQISDCDDFLDRIKDDDSLETIETERS